MSYSLLTKDARLKSQEIQFTLLLNDGYSRQDYKGLRFFTKEDSKYFTLKVFKDAASNHIQFMNYRSLDRRNEVIESYKNNYDSRLKYKEDQKEKNKLTIKEAENKAASGEVVKADTKKSTTLLKKLIREKFGMECSIKSEFYSMGCSLNISYEGGCDSSHLDFIKDALQYGRFDSMHDLSYSADITGLVVDGFELVDFKHIFIRQELTEDLKFQLCKVLAAYVGFPTPENYSDCNKYDIDLFNKCGESTLSQFLFRKLKTSNFCTNDCSKITVLSCDDLNDLNFIYEVDGVQYSTKELKPTTKPEQQTAQTIETPFNSIQVIDYSEKAIAVIGDFSKYYDKLVAAGGRYNSRLSCGKGIIFSKKRIEQVKDILSEPQQQVKEAKQLPAPAIEEKTELHTKANIDTPSQNNFPLQSFKIIWHEGRQNPDYTGAIFNTWEDVQTAFLNLWEVNEKGSGGGYTKVKCEMILTGQEAAIFRVDITDKIKNGDFNPTDQHIVNYLQLLEDESTEPEVIFYDSLQDIKQVANTGKVISLYNLSELVNK